MTSLRSKILTSFGLSTAALLVFVIVVIADLHFVQTHIDDGEAVSILFLSSQKIRLNEKNLLLYRDTDNLKQLREQIRIANEAITSGERVLQSIIGQKELNQLRGIFQKYSTLLDQYTRLDEAKKQTKLDELRHLGHQLSDLTKKIAQRQRKILSETTQFASRTLIIASITVILIGLLSAFYIVRRVVRPLTQLEKQLDQLVEEDVTALKLPSNDTEIQSFVFHFNNMLKQLQTQQQLLRRNERAAALGVLVSGVAHELNNPLSNISTSAQLLLEDSDDSQANELHKQWLAHIDGEAERAKRIVRRLLDTMRRSDQKSQLYEASRLVQSAVILIHRQLSPTLNLHIEAISDTPLWVDADRMKQVFINLIMNSVNAGANNITITGKSGNWKEICTIKKLNSASVPSAIHSQTQKPDKFFRFRVEDDGPGIPEENLEKIFDPFFTTQTGGEGTGLGLYLVQQIIRENNGCISVENREQGGARFTLYFPLPDKSNPTQASS